MKHLVDPAVSVAKGCGDARSKAAPDSAGPSPSATPDLAPGSCLLVQKFQDLKKNSRQDEKLEELKARIRRQRQRSMLRASTERRMLASSAVGSPAQRQPCRKKKVRKIAFVSPTPANTVQRGRAAKKKQYGTSTSPLLEKVQKVQAVHVVNVFAWREGQKLARKILGPLLKYQKLRSGSEGDAAPFAPEPKRHRAMGEVKQSLGEHDGAMPRARRNVGKERKENQMLVDKEDPRESRNRSTRPSYNLGVEKRTVKCQGDATGREEKGRSKPGPDAHHSPGARLVDPGRPSALWMGQRRGSPPRSHPPGKESPPTCHEMAKRGSRSPEQIHAFMNKTLAERNKRFREEKLASKQAQEARNARLQDVYRKQKEAFGRRKSGAATPTTCAKAICGLGREREEEPTPERRAWLQRSSQALLKNEAKLRSDLDQELTRTAEAGSISESPTVASCRTTPEKKPIFGLQEWTPWEKSTVSPSPAKESRVKALQILAQDLSERLDREMGKLWVINEPMSLERQGALSGAPTLSKLSSTIRKPEIPQTGAGAVLGGDAIWDSSFSQNPSRDAGKTQEKIVYRDGFAAHPNKARPGLLTSRPCGEILRHRSSEEEHKAGSVDAHQGCAVNEGLHRDENLSQGQTRSGGLRVTPQHLSGRQSISSHQNIGPQEDGTEDHFGLQPGSSGHILAQPQACGTSSLSVNHGNTVPAEEPVDGSDPLDSTSQWSEISPFYGSSSTFRHFGLSMVEQSLREEELRARHQVALLRLREKALQEKTKAELAWLEHEASCRKSLGDATETSAFIEKQSVLLTKLKQEQAEIWHVQNLCRAAHQERKLLLKQQKDLLVLQQTTAQLWRQLCEQSGKSPQQMLNISNKDTDEASRSGKSRNGSGQQGKGKGSLPAERREISPRGMKTEQQFLKQTPWVDAQHLECLDVRAKGFHSFRNQPVGPAIMGSTVSKQEEDRNGQDTSLGKLSMEENWHPTDKEAGHWTSGMPRDERRSFSPDTEKPQLDLEFHKAHAVLISISGSSFSGSDVEAEDGQDTDVSLPEEFVFQEEPPYNSNSTFCATPAMSQITSNPRNAVSPDSRSHTAVLCGDSKQGRLSVPCKEEKMMEDLPDGERIYEGRSMTPSANGRPKPGSLWTRGSHPVQVSMSASGRKASSLSGSDPESCTERHGVKMLAFQGAAESAAASALTDVSCRCSEEEPRWKRSGAGVGPAEGTWNGENPSPFEDEPTIRVPETLLKTEESVNNTAPLSGSEGRAHSNECAANESQFSRGDKATVQCPKISTEDEDSNVSLQHSRSTGRITKERETSSLANSQNSTESGMATLHPSSSKAGLLCPAQCYLPRSEDATVLPSEDEIVSPVDEVLSYGSMDLPWSTEKDVSFPIEDLPPPPKDLSGNDCDSSHSFQDFPSPPEEVAFPETGECQYALEEDTSEETNNASSSEKLPSPLRALADAFS